MFRILIKLPVFAFPLVHTEDESESVCTPAEIETKDHKLELMMQTVDQFFNHLFFPAFDHYQLVTRNIQEKKPPESSEINCFRGVLLEQKSGVCNKPNENPAENWWKQEEANCSAQIKAVFNKQCWVVCWFVIGHRYRVLYWLEPKV